MRRCDTSRMSLLLLLAVSLIAFAPPHSVLAAGSRDYPGKHPAVADYTDRLIIKFRESAPASVQRLEPADLAQLSGSAGVQLRHLRPMSGNGQVVKLPARVSLNEARAIAARLQARGDIDYAVPDRRRFPLQTPDDPRYAEQWNYMSPFAPDSSAGGANLPAAWDITTGSTAVVAAVVDTGIVPHADLAGRTVPGYNFISDKRDANNETGRSADPTDLGDWITQAESDGTDPVAGDYFKGCYPDVSSWHGSHVAGTIGAKSSNGLGVSGINWTSKILPVRVLGKCGGYDSDIIDGMRWAAGLAVSGVPDNPNPAKVINLSLGGSGNCEQNYQSAIDEILAKGTVIVVAAGNENANVSTSTPANCNGVISVAAVDRFGGRAWYSNYGSGVKIAAPGGAQANNDTTDPNGILSTLNAGTTTPIPSPNGDTYGYYQGTSMATPHVTGIISLMFSVNPDLTPAEILTKLQTSARAFPVGTGSDCTTASCGAGIVDAAAAVTFTKVEPITINNGAPYATTTAVTLAISPPTDGYTSMRLSNNGTHWGKWLPLATTFPWKLSSGNGQKTVYVQFKTATTLSGTYSAGILLDRKRPSGKIIINDTARVTTSRDVTVSIIASDVTSGLESLCLSETKLPCADSQFTPFTATRQFTITSPENGRKSLYVTLKDRAGNRSRLLSDSITLQEQ